VDYWKDYRGSKKLDARRPGHCSRRSSFKKTSRGCTRYRDTQLSACESDLTRRRADYSRSVCRGLDRLALVILGPAVLLRLSAQHKRLRPNDGTTLDCDQS